MYGKRNQRTIETPAHILIREIPPSSVCYMLIFALLDAVGRSVGHNMYLVYCFLKALLIQINSYGMLRDCIKGQLLN